MPLHRVMTVVSSSKKGQSVIEYKAGEEGTEEASICLIVHLSINHHSAFAVQFNSSPSALYLSLASL